MLLGVGFPPLTYRSSVAAILASRTILACGRVRIRVVKACTIAIVFATCALAGCQITRIPETPNAAPQEDQALRITFGGFIENQPERGKLEGVCGTDATRNVLNCDIHNGLLDWTITEITMAVTQSPYNEDDTKYYREAVSIESLKTGHISIRLGLQLPADDVINRHSGAAATLSHWSWLIASAKGLARP
jgi:hypothetical protein